MPTTVGTCGCVAASRAMLSSVTSCPVRHSYSTLRRASNSAAGSSMTALRSSPFHADSSQNDGWVAETGSTVAPK
ncbi:hypothetical protein [Streptomyces nogalater]|uniref:Secreted protein n=1 Tax=Streptomyces nogalater TaxID=38314 RepID=A0ABW0WMY3_STRNO